MEVATRTRRLVLWGLLVGAAHGTLKATQEVCRRGDVQVGDVTNAGLVVQELGDKTTSMVAPSALAAGFHIAGGASAPHALKHGARRRYQR